MRSTVLIIGFVSLAVLVGAPHLSPSSPGRYQDQALQLSGSYDTLAPAQRRLVDDWFQQYNQIMEKELIARDAYDRLPISTRTTFEAVTHALVQTELTDDAGGSLGKAIDLIDQVEAVRGSVPNTGGDSQFRVIVLLRPDACRYSIRASNSHATTTTPTFM